ncbi:hypothetical protein ABL78_7264 [Leptomonas seymouri]|uniref:PDZ domain-containing protein n=1 Tax=Leptomonas seymouri TaxID=5684 RepID=A0A0N0P342_LEPSE|nr:hypothetical protein ABL78_7264 [Leptomonas seymouri]|eukprot:KPI83696.1 hypothetical protein ABL78_7264 [Leptomonas seymouri]
MPTSADEITVPSSSRHRSDDTQDMLRSTDVALAQELSTLHQLQAFYEQHTFDTQGPYADLFAVLFSSCKHLIDVSTALVRHIRAHDEVLSRQQTACRVLCGAVAQHKSDIAVLCTGTACVATTAIEGKNTLRKGSGSCVSGGGDDGLHEEMTHPESRPLQQHLSSIPSSSASATQYDILHPRREDAGRLGSSRIQAHAGVGTPYSGENTRQHSAWKHEIEGRLDTIERQLHVLREYQHAAQGPPQQPPADPNANSNDALVETFEAWKRSFEDTIDDRLAHLTHQTTLLERAAKQHQRLVRWMGVGVDDDAAVAVDAPRPIARKKPETPAEVPPAAVTQWLNTQLQQREEEWLRMLEEVQDALVDYHSKDAEEVHANEKALVSTVTAAHNGTSAEAPSAAFSAVPSRCACLSNALTRLLCTAATKQTKSLRDVARQVQQADEQLRDVTARLEVLEVYAPHRYTLATKPPILGVELEDVGAPRVGVRVQAVYQGYLADRAGLSIGDIIAGVGHESVHTRAQLYVVLTELTRDYNAQCRVQIEEGYLRNYTATSRGPIATSTLANLETGYEDGGTTSFELDHALQLARAEAASACHRARGAPNLKYRGSSTDAAKLGSSNFFHQSSLKHKQMLAQCLPYFELTLHVLRDGRLRDVTLLIPPSEALRSEAEY